MKGTVLFLMASLALASSASSGSASHKSQFEAFEKQFGKSYKDSSERLTRFAIFSRNLKEIEEHNKSGKSLWKKAVNKFADMTQEEFNIASNGYINAPKPSSAFAQVKDYRKIEDLPASVDWRDKGVVGEVKDQGFCGSCWAFAAGKLPKDYLTLRPYCYILPLSVQSIETYLKLESGNAKLEELSPQQITSCSPNPLECGGTGGCMGSVPQLAFMYTQLFGLVTEWDYPYISGTVRSFLT